MAYINVPKVRGKMAEKRLTISAFAEALGINRNTLTAYLEAPGKIPYETVGKMAAILCDSTKEADAIFFANDLRNT